MNAEDVALQYAQSRPGLDLVTFIEVGLPFWRLELQCTLIERHPIPPIEEFVLRAVDAGLTSSEEIAAFLGLDERLSVAALSELLFQGLLTTVGPETYVLTHDGTAVLQDCVMMAARQESVFASYDGLTHDTLLLSDAVLVPPKSLRARGIREWPAFPPDPPGVESIDLTGIRRSWEAKDLHKKRGKEIISVDNVVGKKTRAYLEAVALVYQSQDPGEAPQVAFAIDGLLSEPHERAFAQASGARKMGLLAALAQRSEHPAYSLLGGKVESAKKAAVVEAVENVESAEAKLRLAERRTQLPTAPSITADLRNEIEELKAQLDAAREKLSSFDSRPVPVQEHPGLLRQALEGATERVMIVTPWIKAAVVDLDFLKLLKACVERGVKVTIAYGIGGRDGDGDPVAIKAIHDLGKYGDLALVRHGNTHAKILIKDHEWVVVTSFNWLSFRGDDRRPIRDERGFLCSDQTTVDSVFDEYDAAIRRANK